MSTHDVSNPADREDRLGDAIEAYLAYLFPAFPSSTASSPASGRVQAPRAAVRLVIGSPCG